MTVSLNLKLKPLSNRVVVKVEPEETKTASGLYIPDTGGNSNKPQMGEVIAVGQGKRLDNGSFESMELVVGNRVIFNKYSGTDVDAVQEGCLILREEDIIAVVE